jgi:hypothetical protein
LPIITPHRERKDELWAPRPSRNDNRKEFEDTAVDMQDAVESNSRDHNKCYSDVLEAVAAEEQFEVDSAH